MSTSRKKTCRESTADNQSARGNQIRVQLRCNELVACPPAGMGGEAASTHLIKLLRLEEVVERGRIFDRDALTLLLELLLLQ